MALRQFYLMLVTQLVYLLVISDAQNARSYDTNDWIPITPSGSEQINVERKATGRVLNLDTPAQKFFPDNDYRRKKRPQVQQYLRETVDTKGRINDRPPKINNQPYKYENVPQFNQQQYYNSKEVNIPLVEQPPPLHQPQYIPSTPQLLQPKYIRPPPPPPPLPPQRQQYFQPQVVPSAYQQYNVQPNTSYYQDLNPTSINQELLSAIRDNPSPVEQAKIQPQLHIPTKSVEPNESVQLLYVPLENLKPSQPVSQDSKAIYRQTPIPPPPPPQQQQQQQQVLNYVPQEVNKQHRIANIEQDFIQQALHAHKLQQQLQLGEPIQYQETYTSTTEKPKKRKPHQPPLAVYMGGKNHAEVTDVLNVLKDAKSIAVQDNISSDSPNIFIGPSTLDASQGYSKFPLPYLNNISGSRIERKIEQLPFFVAPLSYKAPPGFSKIPLPSPHVGSVIISHKEEEKLNNHNQYQFTDKPLLKTTPQQISSDYKFGEQPTFLPKENSFQPNKNQYEFDELSHTLPLQFGQQPLNTQEDLRQIPHFSQQYEEPLTYIPKEQPLPQNFDLYNNQPKTTQYEQFPLIKEKSTTTTPAPPRGVEFSQSYHAQKNLYPAQPDLNKQSFTVQEQKPTVPVTPRTNKEHLNENKTKFSSQTNNPQPEYETVKQNEQYINPLELAINQYELQQINNQFDSNKASQYEQPNYEQINYFPNSRLPLNGAPQSIVKENYEQVTTTKEPERIRPQQRRRKPTRISTTTAATTTTTTTIKPTENTFEDNKYTVLEEFSVKTNPSTTQKYTPEIVTNNYNPNKEQTTTSSYSDGVEIQAANVYKLTTPTTSKLTETSTNRNEQQGEIFKIPISQPAYVPENDEIESVHQHILDQQLMDRQILNSQYKNNQQSIQTEATPLQYNSPESVQQYQQNTDHIEPLVRNRGQVQYTDIQQTYLQNTQPVFANYHELNQPQPSLPKETLPGVTNLQEQAVRPLLSPTLLVPTTEEQQQSTSRYESPSTEKNIEIAKLYSTEPVQVETTTARVRTRGRGRGSSSRYTPPTTVSPTRRTVNRRRPIPTRTTTERAKTSTDYSYYDSSERSTKSTSSKQRFRTRGRPAANSITERVSQSTTENEVKAYNSPSSSDGVYHASKLRPEPNSYMQFEHVVDQKKVITIKPEVNDDAADGIKDYHQIYNLQQQDVNAAETPVVDIQITHPVSEPTKITPSQQNEHVGTFIQHTAQLGGVLYNNKNNYDETTTTRTTTKSRGRTRGRSRFATTTTSKPTTAKLTTTSEYVETKDDGNEFYGFIRNTLRDDQPLQVKTYTQQPTQLYSSTYQSSQKPLIVINAEDSDTNENKAFTKSVQFVGQIRPKYQAQNEETTQKSKTRARIRVPTRKTPEQKQSYNEVSAPGATEQATRRSSVIRSRGRAHYKVPENLRKKVESEIDENQNYPPSFFKNRATTTTRPNNFQITIGPNSNDGTIEDDQDPHPSIYSPRFVPKPKEDWTEISNQPLLNHIPIEEKTNTDIPQAMPIVSTDIPVENTDSGIEDETQTISTVDIETTTLVPSTEAVTKKKGRRRGVWKLVRHRPIDNFETAESQNYQSVINTFDNIDKIYPSDKFVRNEENIENESVTVVNSSPVTTTEESSIFDTLYEMFGIKDKNEDKNSSETEISQITTTTTVPPTFPEELTEIPTTVSTPIDENSNSSRTVQQDTVLTDTTTTVPVIVNSTISTTTTTTTAPPTTKSAYEVEPWEMRAVKTSTSTEVSHETEICYKGRCIKSKNRKING